MTKEHKTYINYKMVTSVGAAALMSLGLVGLGGHSAKADINTDSQKQVANTTATNKQTSLDSEKKVENTVQPATNESNNSENQNTTKDNSQSQDPLWQGADLSNGYTDKGYAYVDPTPTSPERKSSYHMTTDQGWSNDLQTIIYNDKTKQYDLYFLHSADGATNPFGPQGQNWNHATSKDLVHFSKQNDAIPAQGPDSPYTWKSAWTGSIVKNKNGMIKGVPDGDYVAYFSGLEKGDGSQNIWAAYSDNDGETFLHPLNSGNPVLDHSWDFASKKADQERDPGVFFYKDKMIMYCAEGDVLGAYQSTDGIKWIKADPNGASKVGGGSVMPGFTTEDVPLECPVIRFMKNSKGEEKTVLFFGGKKPQDGETTGTYYTVGHLDSNGLFANETPARRLDQGSDYYGANFSGSDDYDHPSDSIISMGWVGNWNYTSSGIYTSQGSGSLKSQRLGSYSLARELTLGADGIITSKPIVNGLETKNTQKESGNVSDGQMEENDYHKLVDLTSQPANSKYVLNFSTKDGKNYNGAIKIEFKQGKDSNSIIFDPKTGQYLASGFSSELADGASDYYKNGLYYNRGYRNDSGVKPTDHLTFTIYTDKNSIELFFPNGQAYTTTRFCVNNKQDLTVSSQDPDNNAEYTISSSEVGPELVGYVEKTTPDISGEPSAPSDSVDTDVTPSNLSSTDTSNSNKDEDKNNSYDLTKAVVKSLMHNAIVYDENGSISDTLVIIKAGSVLKTYGIKTIKGQKYYVLKGNKYIKVGNIVGRSRKLHHNAYIYNKYGKRVGRIVLRKGKKIKTYGERVTIYGKKYYIIGKNKFVKVANF